MKRGDILPAPAQTKMEEQIRKRAMKDAENLSKEQKKNIQLYKDYRKTLTGVLIDLHWLRILGQNSKVIASSMQAMGKSLGYLIDVILLPMLPAMLEVSRGIIWIGREFQKLPAGAKTGISTFVAALVAITASATVLLKVSELLKWIGGFFKGGGGAGGQTTLGKFGMKGGMFFAPEMFPSMGKGPYPHDPRERIKIIGKMLGLPGFAAGGVVTSPTLGLLGEKGAEAILPLEKLSGGLFSSLFGKAATGGGLAGMGMTRGSVPELLIKGFQMLNETVSSGFKISNMLLSGLLTLFGGLGGAGGAIAGAAKSIWDFLITIPKSIWEFILTPVRTVWEFIATPVKSVWEFISVTAKSVWEFLLTPAKTVWEFLLTPTKSVWDFLQITTKTVSVGGTPTPTGTTTTTPAGKQVLYSYGLPGGGVGYVYSDGTTSEGRQATAQEMAAAGQGGGYESYIPVDKRQETPLQYVQPGDVVGGTTVKPPYLSQTGTPIDMSKVGGSDVLGSAYPWSIADLAGIVGLGPSVMSLAKLGGSLMSGVGSAIPFMQKGGTMRSDGLAFLHGGEEVIPAGQTGGGSVNIYNPTFQISGRNDRELFDGFLRLLKIEGARSR